MVGVCALDDVAFTKDWSGLGTVFNTSRRVLVLFVRLMAIGADHPRDRIEARTESRMLAPVDFSARYGCQL